MSDPEALCKDIQTLNLTHYTGEVATGLLANSSDGAVNVASYMYRYYPDFSGLIYKQIQRAMVNPTFNTVKFYFQLVVVGILPSSPFVECIVGLNTELIADLLYYGSYFLTGIVPRRFDNVNGLGECSVFDAQQKQRLIAVFGAKFEESCNRLRSAYKDLRRQKSSNKKMETYKGIISEKASSKLDMIKTHYDIVKKGTEILADSLNIDTPNIIIEVENEEEEEKKIEIEQSINVEPLFDDEESRAFYESLPVLSAVVPAVLLKDKGKEDEITESVNVSQKRSDFDEFTESLLSALSRDAVDKHSEKFCYMNTKGNRKRLVEFLYSSNRSRTDILPFLGRMVATLSMVLPDIGVELVTLLKNQFFGIMLGKEQHKLEHKVRVARYIAELVKFKVAHHSLAFEMWEFCLKDFVGHSVFVCCALVECCGRWLFRNPAASERCKVLLARMTTLRSKKYFESHLNNLIENACYMCDPPKTSPIKPTIRSMLWEYLRKLLYVDLSEQSHQIVLKKFLSLSWDEECSFYVMTCFFEAFNVPLEKLSVLSNMLADLDQYFNMAVPVVDVVLEEIRSGLELPNIRLYQVHIHLCCYLAHLFLCYLIDDDVVFSVLFLLVTFNVNCGEDVTFRIRQVETILRTCGELLFCGQNRRRAQLYMLYLQRYVLSSPYLSWDITFLLDEIFELLQFAPQRFSDLNSCESAIADMEVRLPKDKFMKRTSVISPNAVEGENGHDNGGADETKMDEMPNDFDNEIDNDKDFERHTGRSEEDREFLAMFDQTLIETVEQRKMEPRIIKNLTDADTLILQSSRSKESPIPLGNNVKFQLFMRKNKTVVSRDLNVPLDAELAVRNMASEKELLEEQQLLKEFVRQSQYYDDDDDRW